MFWPVKLGKHWLTFDLEDVHSLMKRTEQSWNLLVDQLFLWNIEGIRHHTVWPKTSILFESLWFPKILRLWSLWYWMWILIWLWLLCPYQCQHKLLWENLRWYYAKAKIPRVIFLLTVLSSVLATNCWGYLIAGTLKFHRNIFPFYHITNGY